MTRTLLAALLLAASPALAQDDLLDDLPDAGGTDLAPAPEPAAPEEGDLLGEEGDLLGDEPDDDLLGEPSDGDLLDEEGQNSDLFSPDDEAEDDAAEGEAAAAYRRVRDSLIEATPEERLTAWEEYLQNNPSTPFLEQVSKEIAQAESELYGEGIVDETNSKSNRREIAFPEAVLMDNLNPATRFRAGFEFGLPEWINVFADMEYALTGHFSTHAGIRKRYTGWTLELGPRFSPLKIEDPDVIVTIAGDLQVGFEPAIIGLRPMLLAGVSPIDRLFFQVNVGPSWEAYDGFWTPRLRSGGNLTFRAARPVALFIEGAVESKYFGWPGGDLQFHTVAFGMRFFPAKESEREDAVEATLGAAVPAYFNYPNFLFHEGAASVQGAFYME